MVRPGELTGNPMQRLVRKTFRTRQIDEVAFSHFFPEHLEPHVRADHPGVASNPEGVTFSLTMSNLVQILTHSAGQTHVRSFSWRIPLRQDTRPITTVVVSTPTSGNRPADGILQHFNPERAAISRGKLAFHFFDEAEATVFVRTMCGLGAQTE